MDAIKLFRYSTVSDKLILTGLMFILILFGFADLTTYIGLIFMLTGGILLARKEGLNVFNNYINRPVLIYILYATLSLFYVSSFYKAISGLGGILEVFIPFFTTFYIVKRKKEINKFMLFSLFSGSVIIAVYAFYEYFILDLRRVGSLTGNANILGVYMLFVLSFIFTTLIYNSNRKIKITMVILFIINFAALLFSGSRAAFFGVIASFLFIIINQRNKIYFILLIILLIIPLFLPFNIYDRLYDSFQSLLSGTGDQRIYIWKNALDMFRLRPLTGVGIGQYPIYYKIYEGAPVKYRIFTHAHNIYLHILAELGLIGLCIFLWLIYKIIKFTIINYNNIKNDVVLFALLASLIGFMIQELFEFSITDSGGTTLLVGIMLGWYIGLLSANENNDQIA